MSIINLFKVFGGLALFLFGMSFMGSILEKMSGGKMERILEKLSNNPIKGVLLGAGVTAAIQSSSATTVMVVGFVNSGIMKLEQAVGIIMGANIGTTVTSWILSLAGIESDNIFMQFLKPEIFANITALTGVILYMFIKNSKYKDLGSILLGFSVLMFGMSMMSGAVKPLAEVPQFQQMLLLFTNPIFGVLAGALITAIIQSSAASVGMLQALSMTGGVTYGSAMPIIMGQNIGTCITAIISSIGANKNAKRAAMVHLYFNLIGTVFFLVVYYTLNAIFKFPFVNDSLTAGGVAIIHTVFNILSTMLLLPFSKVLCKLAVLTVRDSNESDMFPMLDERFLNTPSFAIEQCKNVAHQMAIDSRNTLFKAISLIDVYDDKVAAEVENEEDNIDKYEDKLGTYMVKLSSNSLSLEDSHQISKLLHIIGDLERIGDHALNISEVAKEMHEKGIRFSKGAQEELVVIGNAIREILNITIDSFCNNDVKLASHVEPLEQVIDNLKSELKARHINRLQYGECTIELGFIFADLLTNYERVSDHCSNIAVCLIRVSQSDFDTHKYLNEVKHSEDGEFIEDYNEFRIKYSLPEVPSVLAELKKE